MSVMSTACALSRHGRREKDRGHRSGTEAPVFDAALLAQFETALRRASVVRYQAGPRS